MASQVWRAPRRGTLRVNVKGILPRTTSPDNKCGIGCLVRNSEGKATQRQHGSSVRHYSSLSQTESSFSWPQNCSRLTIELDTSDMEAEHAISHPQHFRDMDVRALVNQIVEMFSVPKRIKRQSL